MPIYIATLAGLLSIVVLVTVYLADRYEREPIELIQDAFLLGACAQLVLILIAQVSNGAVLWAGPWLAVTIVGAALYLPFHLERLNEMDERFDGIVYTVALLAGAFCVIHLNNLSVVASVSQHGSVLAEHLWGLNGPTVVLVSKTILACAAIAITVLGWTRVWSYSHHL